MVVTTSFYSSIINPYFMPQWVHPKGQSMIGVYGLKSGDKIVYIGSSSRNILQRKSYHLREIRNGTHKNEFLKGLDSVEFVILEETSIDDCRKRETFYLDKFKPPANKQVVAAGHLSLRKGSHDKAAAKRWAKKSERKKASISAKRRWANISDEEREKNNRLLEKNREKNRDFHVSHCKTTLADAKKKPVIRSDGKVYDSIKQASEKTGIGRTAINNCLAGRVKTSGGYGWKYLQGGVSSHT